MKKTLENIQTRKDVANLLEIKDSSLRFYLYGLEESEKYRDFLIKKWNGSYRTISAPESRIRLLQKRLLHVLEEVYEPKKTVYGFVKGKCIVDNASNHVNKKWVLNIDLEDFFSQIHFGRVMGAIKSKPFNVGEQAALVMAQIICHNGSLPQGGCTSPIITNIVCRSLDNDLLAFAKRHHLVYTRYADDITFSSSNRSFPKEAAVILNGKCILGGEDLSYIQSFKPDVILSSQSLYFGQKLLDIPEKCCINRHSGLLPRNGGLWPGFQAVRKGETETGVSVHIMESTIDAGIVLSQIRIKIRTGETVWDIYKECFDKSTNAVIVALDKIRNGDFSPIENGYEREYYSFPTKNHWREFRRRGGKYA